MNFEWDLVKAKANLLRHGVDFADAATCFHDRNGWTIADPDAVDEERYITIAQDDTARLLVTCFTIRAESTRIISSRKASHGERRRYEMSL